MDGRQLSPCLAGSASPTLVTLLRRDHDHLFLDQLSRLGRDDQSQPASSHDQQTTLTAGSCWCKKSRCHHTTDAGEAILTEGFGTDPSGKTSVRSSDSTTDFRHSESKPGLPASWCCRCYSAQPVPLRAAGSARRRSAIRVGHRGKPRGIADDLLGSRPKPLVRPDADAGPRRGRAPVACVEKGVEHAASAISGPDCSRPSHPRHRALVATAAGAGLRWARRLASADALDLPGARLLVIRTVIEVSGTPRQAVSEGGGRAADRAPAAVARHPSALSRWCIRRRRSGCITSKSGIPTKSTTRSRGGCATPTMPHPDQPP